MGDKSQNNSDEINSAMALTAGIKSMNDLTAMVARMASVFIQDPKIDEDRLIDYYNSRIKEECEQEEQNQIFTPSVNFVNKTISEQILQREPVFKQLTSKCKLDPEKQQVIDLTARFFEFDNQGKYLSTKGNRGFKE